MYKILIGLVLVKCAVHCGAQYGGGDGGYGSNGGGPGYGGGGNEPAGGRRIGVPISVYPPTPFGYGQEKGYGYGNIFMLAQLLGSYDKAQEFLNKLFIANSPKDSGNGGGDNYGNNGGPGDSYGGPGGNGNGYGPYGSGPGSGYGAPPAGYRR